MDAEALLCDYAEALNGKLYISGGCGPWWVWHGLCVVRWPSGWQLGGVRPMLSAITRDAGHSRLGRPPWGQTVSRCCLRETSRSEGPRGWLRGKT